MEYGAKRLVQEDYSTTGFGEAAVVMADPVQGN